MLGILFHICHMFRCEINVFIPAILDLLYVLRLLKVKWTLSTPDLFHVNGNFIECKCSEPSYVMLVW